MPLDATGAIAHAIQLAIAPVFLLTGVGGLLGVMANRLARVIDRARMLEGSWSSMDAEARAAALPEVHNLERRRRLCSYSITCCTAAALFVSLVIVTLFVEEFFDKNLRWLAGGLFVAAMLGVICGLTCFLREVHLATHTTIIDPKRYDVSR